VRAMPAAPLIAALYHVRTSLCSLDEHLAACQCARDGRGSPGTDAAASHIGCLGRVRAREWITRPMIGVEPPRWQGARKQHTPRR
jgi:hypothetical protein